MHMLIASIVYARKEEEAFIKAKQIFFDLCEQGGPFDYFVTFDQDTAVAGKNRWGPLPVVARADSKEGKQLVARLMKGMKNEFMEYMSLIRGALAVMSDRELFHEELSEPTQVLNRLSPERDQIATEPHMVKYYMHQISQDIGPGVSLYDHHGEGIRTPSRLKNALEKQGPLYRSLAEARREGKLDEEYDVDSPYQNMDAFVVPADVHY